MFVYTDTHETKEGDVVKLVILLTKERKIEYPCVVCGSPFIMATGIDTNNDDSYICKCPKCGAVCSVAQDDIHAPEDATEEEHTDEEVEEWTTL